MQCSSRVTAIAQWPQGGGGGQLGSLVALRWQCSVIDGSTAGGSVAAAWRWGWWWWQWQLAGSAAAAAAAASSVAVVLRDSIRDTANKRSLELCATIVHVFVGGWSV